MQELQKVSHGITRFNIYGARKPLVLVLEVPTFSLAVRPPTNPIVPYNVLFLLSIRDLWAGVLTLSSLSKN